MSCFRPLSGFINPDALDDKHKLIIKPYKRVVCFYAGKRLDEWIPIPCGKCAGCKMDHANAWSVRLQLESSLYPDEYNSFITLTYNDDNNPVTLVKRDVQLFMKRLRAYFSDYNVRFFLAGEYGSNTARPHYHLLLFNCLIPDLVPYSKLNPNGLYTSDILDSIWKLGNVIIGKVTERSIKYTARYCLKKVYETPETKEIYKKLHLEPEFTLMSRRPGIGANAFKKEWFEWNYIPLNGRKYPINRFYIDIFKKLGFDYEPIKEYMKSHYIDVNTMKIGSYDAYFDELNKREIEFQARIDSYLKRGLDQYGII